MTTLIFKPKNQALRDFIDTYKKKPMPTVTIAEFMKQHNHEIWRKCKNCGNEEDLRKDTFCTLCGADLLKQ